MTKELFRLPLLWIAPERRCLLQKRMCKFKILIIDFFLLFIDYIQILKKLN